MSASTIRAVLLAVAASLGSCSSVDESQGQPADGPGADDLGASLTVTPQEPQRVEFRALREPALTYVVSNPGRATVSWRLEASVPWIGFSHPDATLLPGAALTVGVWVEEGAAAAGADLESPVFMKLLDVEVGGTLAVLELFVSLSEELSAWAIEEPADGTGSVVATSDSEFTPPASARSERPGPDTTGPSDPGSLAPSGTITVKRDGQVIENVDVTGTINIQANNVTIRNFRIDANGRPYGINAGAGYSGTILEDGEITDTGSCGILGSGFTARRLNIHEGGGDGIKARGEVLVEGCWIHHLGTSEGAHADGNQTRVGSNIVFRGNNIDMPIGQSGYRSNAAFMIHDDLGVIDNFVIENNWLNGGNYTVMMDGQRYGGPTNFRLINNRFGRGFRYGTLSTDGVEMVVSGNVWDDTGTPVPINNR